MKRRLILIPITLLLVGSFLATTRAKSPSPTSGQKPNILVIFGDDIGQTNLSAYSFGLMGYRTPNIDRIAKEGMFKRQHDANKPFFCWMNTTRMHFRTHVREAMRDKPGINSRTEYADGMLEHDGDVGKLLKALDDLGLTDNTIVLYTTDNGPHQNSWPDAGTTPFRSEKNTNWEGAFRVPCLLRWPGHIQPGSVSNGIVSGLDWLPTFMATVGDTDVTNKLLKGYDVGGKTYKVHLDGYNQLPYLTGQQDHSARKEFIYFNDDGDLVALRYENWKAVFEEQRVAGTMRVWAEPFTKLRVPKLFNLRSDPYERADITSNTYYDWFMSDGAGPFLATQPIVAKFLGTFKDYPPSQRPSSFSIDQLVEKMQRSFAPSSD